MKGLLVVDMQNDFLDVKNGSLNLGHDTTVLQNNVANFIKDFDGDIICSYDTHNTNACEFEMFPSHCVKGTEGHNLAPPIQKALTQNASIKGTGGPTLMLGEKNSYTGNGIIDVLSENYDELHVVGVCTHICVHDLVAAYVNRVKNSQNKNPKVIVHQDMIDDFDPEMASFALKRLQNLYGVEVR